MPRVRLTSRPLRSAIARLRSGLRPLRCFAICTLGSVIAIIIILPVFIIGATVTLSGASALMLLLADL